MVLAQFIKYKEKVLQNWLLKAIKQTINNQNLL